MIELISFLFFKALAVAGIFIVWAWPPALAFFLWYVADELFDSRWGIKIWQAICIFFGVFGSITYYGAMVPGPAPAPHTAPADQLYHYVFRGFGEQQLLNELNRPPVRTEVGTELRRYRLDGWAPPKHFYVSLTDLVTGKKHERLYVSKHCNASSSLKRGEEYNIVLRKYKMSNEPDVVRYEFSGLYEVFC